MKDHTFIVIQSKANTSAFECSVAMFFEARFAAESNREVPMFVQSKFFECEDAALDELERVVWGGTAVCPHCGNKGAPYDLRRTRPGLRKCRRCARQFSVRIGTALQASHVPAHKWLQAVFLICGMGKRMSARRLARVLGISYKSAWQLTKHVREAEIARTGHLHPGASGIAGKQVALDFDSSYDLTPLMISWIGQSR